MKEIRRVIRPSLLFADIVYDLSYSNGLICIISGYYYNYVISACLTNK
jgi:hypothetical protein